MKLCLEFVRLALQEGANRRELCRRFGTSAKTSYKLLACHARDDGPSALAERSRRPLKNLARANILGQAAGG